MNKTIKKGTITTEGFIPHRPHAGLDMPVKLAIPRLSASDQIGEFYPPLRSITGNLIYALPGGGNYE